MMSVKWRTKEPVYRCPPDCGLCCHGLLVEASATDVLREPRIHEVYPLKKSDRSLPVIDNTWVLSTFDDGCKFLDEHKRCSIYSTRPNVCVNFAAGGTKCRDLRKDYGLPPLEGTKADGSMGDRLAAELVKYENDEGDEW